MKRTCARSFIRNIIKIRIQIISTIVFIMNSDLITLLHQVCGTELADITKDSLDPFTFLLARFFAVTPPQLWRLHQRNEAQLTSCPTCDTPYVSSILHSHSDTCAYLPLCFPVRRETVSHILHYLQKHWKQTKTTVVLEMNYHPCHVIMAYMQLYPYHFYKHAGKLVEALLHLEDIQAPTWDVTHALEWMTTSNTSSSTELIPPVFRFSTQTPSTSISQSTHHEHRQASSMSERKQTLVNETFKLALSTRCKVCYKAEANALALECGHLFLCISCIPSQKTCPICCSPIVEYMKVFRG